MKAGLFSAPSPITTLRKGCVALGSGLAVTPLVCWIPADRLGLMSVKPTAYVGAILVASAMSFALALVAWGSRGKIDRSSYGSSE